MAAKKSSSSKNPAAKKTPAPKFGTPAFNKLHRVGQFGKKSKGK